MNNITVTKQFSWEMSHLLYDHKGSCKNLHGHSYKLEVTVKNIDNNLQNGMVLDFKDLKEIVTKNVVDLYDHAFVYYDNPNKSIENEIADLLNTHNLKCLKLNKKTTAENMLSDIAQRIIPSLNNLNVKLYKLKLWETSTSFAEVIYDE